MKHIKLFENFKNESLELYNREQSWLSAIYVTYKEQQGLFGEFKHVTEEEYYDLLSDKVDKKRTVEFDMNRVYRLADSKEIWLGKYGKILGEVWYEDDMVSYWIKIEY